MNCRSGKRAILQLLENVPFLPSYCGTLFTVKLTSSGCPSHAVQTVASLGPCEDPVNLLFDPAQPYFLPRLMETTQLFSQFLHLCCSIAPASQERWQGLPEHPLTPHGPFLSEHKPRWTLITHCCTSAPPTSPHMVMEACGAIPVPLPQLLKHCSHSSIHIPSSGPSHLTAQNNN